MDKNTPTFFSLFAKNTAAVFLLVVKMAAPRINRQTNINKHRLLYICKFCYPFLCVCLYNKLHATSAAKCFSYFYLLIVLWLIKAMCCFYIHVLYWILWVESEVCRSLLKFVEVC